MLFDDFAPDADFLSPNFGFAEHDPFAADTQGWRQQTTSYTCAVVSQQMILEQFGVIISEADLVYEATSAGFLTNSGTRMDDLGRLLEGHGVATHESIGVDNLLNDLAHGRKVIVAVDGGELWGTDSVLEDRFQGQTPDHAVVINGLDMSDPSNPIAVINDPGHPEGAGMRVPLDRFIDAWNDSDQFYVATDNPPPALGADPVLGNGFNESDGMYMDSKFWESFREARGLAFEHFTKNVDQVSDRLMDSGGMLEGYAASVVKACSQTIQDLNDDERSSLARQI
ncbi:cysteine peptidase family C39 domain-containing protein [Aporhodopirellula aestuarii]|uniref:Peptidase C39-like domain-containing protein n=1 Tax=Aporhodopirellula aestuarii TaxID=2950107 RepID=A0ABT0U5R0_9BACT|nr:hypothetical protein [Aporhodopirellula aestuarii]MCM2371875.1 hypothetical protein [Aporhodopirellula aestuarii]